MAPLGTTANRPRQSSRLDGKAKAEPWRSVYRLHMAGPPTRCPSTTVGYGRQRTRRRRTSRLRFHGWDTMAAVSARIAASRVRRLAARLVLTAVVAAAGVAWPRAQ